MDIYKPTILLDLDGVLNNYTGNFDKTEIPDMKTGAYEFLKKLNLKYKIIIFTTREMLQTANWLRKNKLEQFVDNISNVKLPAYLHIDDRAICFNGNYENTMKEIENFNVYWKN